MRALRSPLEVIGDLALASHVLPMLLALLTLRACRQRLFVCRGMRARGCLPHSCSSSARAAVACRGARTSAFARWRLAA